jgi:hypothetical protein
MAMGGVGVGNMFYRYAANYRALRNGSCEITEGRIAKFRPISGKGGYEEFEVSGHHFGYAYNNLGGSGLRFSGAFLVPLRNGLYVKIWHREGVICRLDALLEPSR